MSKTRIIAEDTIVLFADLQAGIADLPMTVTSDRLRKGVSGLARLAALFEMPAVATVVQGRDAGSSAIMPEISQALGVLNVVQRATADAFRNETILKAISASDRKTVLISGVATELAVQLPALTGSDLGYRMFVVVDACGGMSTRTERAAFQRMQAAGVSMVSVMSLAGELTPNLGDAVGQKAVPIIFEMATAG
jgi:nicotinamidase-related amidase